MAEEKLNLMQKLSKIRQMCEVIAKDAKGYNYKYVSISEILARVTAGMKKYEVSLIPMICHDSVEASQIGYKKVKFLKTGESYEEPVNEYLVKGNMIYRWVDDITGEVLDVPFYMIGSQSDPSQGMGSGLSYSLRYFLLDFFQISALDEADPDRWRTTQKESENAEAKQIATAIVDQVDKIVKEKMTEENKPGLINVIKKYAKKGGKATADYYAIEDPAIASNLLEAINTYFKEEK